MEKEKQAIWESMLRQMQTAFYGTPPYSPQEDAPGIYLETGWGDKLDIILRDTSGQETRLHRGTPAEELVMFSDAEEKMLPPPNRTYWRERIKMTYDFDPELEFSDVMQYMLQGTELLQTLIPKENYISQARGGHESLREKYREGKET